LKGATDSLQSCVRII